MPYTYDYPRPAYTVDAVVIDRSGENVLLVKRKNAPFKDHWALPGGFVEIDENGIDAVKREVEEECSIQVKPLIEIGCFDDIDRDPRGRVISVAFLCELEKPTQLAKAGSDAAEIAWFPFSTLPKLAFDHSRIIEQALLKAEKELTYLNHLNLEAPISLKKFVTQINSK